MSAHLATQFPGLGWTIPSWVKFNTRGVEVGMSGYAIFEKISREGDRLFRTGVYLNYRYEIVLVYYAGTTRISDNSRVSMTMIVYRVEIILSSFHDWL